MIAAPVDGLDSRRDAPPAIQLVIWPCVLSKLTEKLCPVMVVDAPSDSHAGGKCTGICDNSKP